MNVIKKAQKLLETAWYSDMDLIRECRAELMNEYAISEQKYSALFQLYELKRPTIYLQVKWDKKAGKLKTQMSDMDIDRHSKKRALEIWLEEWEANTYLVEKWYVKVIHRYLNELRDLQIGLMHQAKDTLN